MTTAEKIIHFNGVDICVSTFGPPTAPPIILLAGGASSMLFWDEDFCSHLAAGPNFVIRYDLRDTGRSTTCEPGAASYTLRDFANDALGVLDAFGLNKAHFVGFSLGGGVSQLIAIENPDRIMAMTLISTGPVGAYRDEPDLLPMSEEHLSKFVALPPPNWSNKEEVVSFLVQHARLCASSSHDFDEAIETTRASRVFGRSTKLSSMFNHSAIAHTRWARERLGKITVPTLVIHGDEDCVIPYPHGVALSKEVPNAELLTMEQTGHEIPQRIWNTIIPAIERHQKDI